MPEHLSQSETWRERVGCTCRPGDGSEVCPREEECMAAWHEDQKVDRSATSAENDDSGKFWRVQGVYVERLLDGGLRVWVQGQQVVLGVESAESLLQWMDRSRW